MLVSDFLSELGELMEVEQALTLETRLADLEEFNSLAVMAIVALVDERFDIMLMGQQLTSITTVGSLVDLIGTDRFSS